MKDFRKKIRRLLYLIYCIVALSVIAVSYVYSSRNFFQSVSRVLSVQFQMSVRESDTGAADSESTFPAGDTGPAPGEGSTQEKKQTEALLLVARNKDQTLYIRSRLNTTMSDDEIRSLAWRALETGKRQGIVGCWQFETSIDGEDLLIGMADISQIRDSLSKLLLVCAVAFSAGFLIWRIIAGKITEKMLQPLAEAERKQKEFVMFAGHELKTPVTVLKVSLSMMKKDGVKSRYLEDAEAENQRMQEMITELLDYSKLDYQAEATLKRVDLSNVAESCLLAFDVFAYENNVELTGAIEPGICISGDEKLLERMMDALLENAISHTPKGMKAEIVLKKSGKNEAILQIRNQGQEIQDQDRKKIFELFYHEPGYENSKGDHHYGLGLAIASSIASKHHTKINVTCAEGWNDFKVCFERYRQKQQTDH